MVIGIVVPIFAIILFGYIAGRTNLLPHHSSHILNNYVYYFALPAILFFSIATAPIDQLTNFPYLIGNVIIIIGGFFLAFVIFKLIFQKKKEEATLLSMAASYGNTGFLGIPLMIAAFGQEAAVPAAITTFLYDFILLTIVVLMLETKGQDSILKSIFKTSIRNPINLAILFGIFIAFLKLSLPGPVKVFTETLGNAAGPTALFALGLGLVRQGQKKDKKNSIDISIIFILKLVVQPLIAILLVTFVLDIEPLWEISFVILSALPTGALTNVFAERYNIYQKQMPSWILYTTLLSLGTLTVFLFLLQI